MNRQKNPLVASNCQRMAFIMASGETFEEAYAQIWAADEYRKPKMPVAESKPRDPNKATVPPMELFEKRKAAILAALEGNELTINEMRKVARAGERAVGSILKTLVEEKRIVVRIRGRAKVARLFGAKITSPCGPEKSATPIVWGGRKYPSMSDCADAIGKSRHYVRSRLMHGKEQIPVEPRKTHQTQLEQRSAQSGGQLGGVS